MTKPVWDAVSAGRSYTSSTSIVKVWVVYGSHGELSTYSHDNLLHNFTKEEIAWDYQYGVAGAFCEAKGALLRYINLSL